MYDNQVLKTVYEIVPSSRNELEITEVNNHYLRQQKLFLKMLGRGVAWFDAGNCDSLFKASAFVHSVEKRQGLKIACLEEIALHMNFITQKEVKNSTTKLLNSEYGRYLEKLY